MKLNRGDQPGAIFRVVRLWAELVMPVKWIPELLPMGPPGYVNLLLYRQRKAPGKGQSI